MPLSRKYNTVNENYAESMINRNNTKKKYLNGPIVQNSLYPPPLTKKIFKRSDPVIIPQYGITSRSSITSGLNELSDSSFKKLIKLDRRITSPRLIGGKKTRKIQKIQKIRKTHNTRKTRKTRKKI